MFNNIYRHAKYYGEEGALEENNDIQPTEENIYVDNVDLDTVKLAFVLLGIMWLMSTALLLLEFYIYYNTCKNKFFEFK